MPPFTPTGSWNHELAQRFGGAPLPFEWDLRQPPESHDRGVVLPGALGWRQMGRRLFQPPLELLPDRGTLEISDRGRARARLGDSVADLGEYREVVLSINRVHGDSEERYSSWLLLPERHGHRSLEVCLDPSFRVQHPKYGEVLASYDDWEELREVARVPGRLVAHALGVELRELRQDT